MVYDDIPDHMFPAQYYAGIVHPPPGHPGLDYLPDGYSLDAAELFRVAARMTNITIQVEHEGIMDAVDRASSRTGEFPNRNAVITELHDLGQSHAIATPVGRVVKAMVIEPSGALYAIIKIHEGYKWLGWLIQNGFLLGLSLTSLESPDKGVYPFELSLVETPARPHSYIVYASMELPKVEQYIRDLELQIKRDHSADLPVPYRLIMASKAEAEKIQLEAPKDAEKAAVPSTEPTSTPGFDTQAFVNAVTSVNGVNGDLIMAGFQMLQQRAESLVNERDTQLARANAAEQRGKVNSAFLTTQLEQHRKAYNSADVPYVMSVEENAITTENADEVRAAWQQSLVQASMGRMKSQQIAAATQRDMQDTPESSNELKRKAEVSEKMSKIGDLIMASNTRLPKEMRDDASTPSKPATPDEQRVIAAMRIKQGFDKFGPLD